MTKRLDFIAIDFETATGKRASICEAGICVVKDGKVVETKSWLVRPEDNAYSYWNIQIHGIHPEDTENAPEYFATAHNPRTFLFIEKSLL